MCQEIVKDIAKVRHSSGKARQGNAEDKAESDAEARAQQDEPRQGRVGEDKARISRARDAAGQGKARQEQARQSRGQGKAW